MAHKLLLADDSITIQRVVELTFADEDVQVISVGDGQAAVDRIERERPDIVLVDADMPERNGYEVASFVKGTPHLSHIPVVLLTGRFDQVDDRRARAAGCDASLAKPFEPQALVNRVRELLGEEPRREEPYPGLDSLDQDVWDVVAPPELPALPERTAPPPAPPPAPEAPRAEREARSALAFEPEDRREREIPPVNPVRRDMPPVPADLEDYFDRLDAAFAGVATEPAPGAAERAGYGRVEPFPVRGPAGPDDEPPRVSRVEAPIEAEPEAVASAVRPVGEAHGIGTRPAPMASPQPVAAPARPPAPTPAGLADMFAELLAEEQRAPQAEAAPAALDENSREDLVEQVTRRVIARLADRSIREIVHDVVRGVAEQLVREEISRMRESSAVRVPAPRSDRE